MTFLNVVFFASAIVQQQGTSYQPNQQADVAAASRAARQAEVSFGKNHPATAMMIRNLALAYERNGSFILAESGARRAIAILEDAFGPNDVSLVPALNVLAETYAGEGRYAEARETALRAVAIGPDAGAHYGTALHNVGAILETEGRLVEAGEYYRKALAARQASLPAGHAFTEDTRLAMTRVEHAVRLASK